MKKNLLIKPELMSPAGHWPQLKAAIEAGADAVYFGLNHFSARAKVGFDVDELPLIFETLQSRGVKGFVTFNTLVFDEELEEAESAIARIADAGADAVIVQDIGVAQMCREVAPNLTVHGSTQMSITSAEGAELARLFGCSRVVLGRELSLSDIEKISKATNVELETFVHGALCVSYSGQCFSSEAWGGRSANRGQCAQACRLAYDLIVDDEHRELGEYRYLLSPGDLYAIEQVPKLVGLGIACLKIEGRYKDENYVALTTRAYRQAIDRACSVDHTKRKLTDGLGEPTKDQLEQIYSRGLGPHFMSGVNHQTVVNGRAPRHRGVDIGRVVHVAQNHVAIQAETEVKPGDGLVFDAAAWRSPGEPEEGGNVYSVRELDNGEIELKFAAGKIDFSRIRVGDWVWRTADHQLLKKIKPIAQAKKIVSWRDVEIVVSGKIGEPLVVSAEVRSPSNPASVDAIRVSVNSTEVLQPARNRHLNDSILNEQLGRLGDSGFQLSQMTNRLQDKNVFLPVSELNAVRRKIVEKLKKELVESGRTAAEHVQTGFVQKEKTKISETALPISTPGGHNSNEPVSDTRCRWHVLVRSSDQLEAAIDLQPESITLDYLELYGLRPSVEKIRQAGICPRVASPRILKPAEQNVIRFLTSLECELLVRSGGLLLELTKIPENRRPQLIGDFSLNAANFLAATALLDLGVSRITPSHDLNAKQISKLCGFVSPHYVEVVAFHHMPVFHTEHCVFCRFLSEGTDHTNCGHPCETHRISLRDQQGRKHPVMADVGCRNTVFGSEGQSGHRHLARWIRDGLRDFRLEFVHESPEEIVRVGQAFQAATDGRTTYTHLANQLKDIASDGITEGSLYVADSPLIQLNVDKD